MAGFAVFMNGRFSGVHRGYLRTSQNDVQTIRLDLENEKQRSEKLEAEIKDLKVRLEGYRLEVEQLKSR